MDPIYELPSYDYAISDKLQRSQCQGIYNNASNTSYKNGERFTVDFADAIDTQPTLETCQYLLNHGVASLRMDHAQEVDRQVVLSRDGLTVEFFPQKLIPSVFGKRPHLPRKPVLPKGDTDRTIQCLFPFVMPSEIRMIAGQANEEKSLDSDPSSPSTSHISSPPPSYNSSIYTASSRTPFSGGRPRSPTAPHPRPRYTHYYEVIIVSNPYYDSTCLAVGLTTRPYPLFRMPGWNRHSVGWHSDDGNKFCDDAHGGLEFSDGFGEEGDVIGCGYVPADGAVFFTKNGRMVGEAFRGLRHYYFPSFGADGPVTVKFNFGRERFTFTFDAGLIWLGKELDGSWIL